MSVFGLQAGRYSRLPKSSGNHNKSFEMSTVAQQLRHAREAQKLTIEQVADITKIRTDHVRAIENGEYHVFSAPVYTRGFIRTYSNLVKLDPAQVLAALDAELGQSRNLPGTLSHDETRHGALDSVTLQLSKIDWRKSMLGLGSLAAMLALVEIGRASCREGV